MKLEDAHIISHLASQPNYKFLRELIAEREALSAAKLLDADLSTREAHELQIKAKALTQALRQIEEEAESEISRNNMLLDLRLPGGKRM